MIYLITGGSSGIGREFSLHYQKIGTVISINRSNCEIYRSLDVQNLEAIDITDCIQVQNFLSKLIEIDLCPDVFILNAGINLPDFNDVIDIERFTEVYKTNFDGVLSFVVAIRNLNLQNKRIVLISSTSNIVPNPSHLGYYLSKINLKLLTKILKAKDFSNSYICLELGPIKTNIMSRYPSPVGFKKYLLQLLSVETKKAVPLLVRAINSNKNFYAYPLRSIMFYRLVALLLFIFPRLKTKL